MKDGPDAHLKAAERVRRMGEEHEQEFIDERNYSENFLEQLDEAVDDLRAAAQVDRGSARAKHSCATKDVEKELTRARVEETARRRLSTTRETAASQNAIPSCISRQRAPSASRQRHAGTARRRPRFGSSVRLFDRLSVGLSARGHAQVRGMRLAFCRA